MVIIQGIQQMSLLMYHVNYVLLYHIVLCCKYIVGIPIQFILKNNTKKNRNVSVRALCIIFPIIQL